MSSANGKNISSKNRGTQDDLEVLKIIIDAHPGLKTRILKRLRELKDTNKGSGLQVGIKK